MSLQYTKRGFMFRLAAMLLALVMVLPFCGCQKTENDASGERTKLSFKQALQYDYLKSLAGKPVTINGYLATSSPVDGSFIFLMNLPYQSCPFCVPNTTELSNTMEVYPKAGQTFTYTNQAVKVEGILDVATDPNKPFTDLYGYQFSFRIIDATYTILKEEDLSSEIALWQKFAATDIITRINSMYDYVNFLCAWNTYFVNSYEDADGKVHPGYYLYPSDAKKYLTQEGGQFNYGYAGGDAYFDKIIADIRAVDATAFSDLIQNIESAKRLAAEALQELEDGHYTYEEKYVEKFGTTDYVYTLDRGEELTTRMETLFREFSAWLGGWEL